MTPTNWKEIEEEFDEKFKCIQSDCDGTGHAPRQITDEEWEDAQCQFHAEYIFPLKSFIRTNLQAVDEAAYQRGIADAIKVVKAEEVDEESPDDMTQQALAAMGNFENKSLRWGNNLAIERVLAALEALPITDKK